jgi:fructose-1,6-bisphosphatase/inositol monophosphatase family enzyme
LAIAEKVRQQVLLPASQELDLLEITTKNVDGQRSADAKTITIKTDNECEEFIEKIIACEMPNAFFLSEEMYGRADAEEKRRLIHEALTTTRPVMLVDPLDATRDFKNGGDGYGVMLTLAVQGQVKASVIRRCTDDSELDGHGHAITYGQGDAVRYDGQVLRPLNERSFPDSAIQMRGYAGVEFIDVMRKPGAHPGFPNLTNKFDSISDLWTCGKMTEDLLKGTHHFMLVTPPVDIFDYPAAVTMLTRSGGVARFLDGTPATMREILIRQNRPIDIYKDTLVFAVSDKVFDVVRESLLTAPRVPGKAKVIENRPY